MDGDFGMKKLSLLILTACILLSFVACNNGENTPSVDESELDSSLIVQDGFTENKNVSVIKGYLGEAVDRNMLATDVFYERPYTLSRPASEIYSNNGSKLTNGQTMELIYGAYSHVGFEGGSNVSVTIDAGEGDHNIADIAVCCVRIKDYSYDLPQKVTVEVSNDGKKFTLISS